MDILFFQEDIPFDPLLHIRPSQQTDFFLLLTGYGRHGNLIIITSLKLS